MVFRRLFSVLLLLPILAATGCLDVLTGTAVRSRVALVVVQLAEANEPLDGERLDVSITGPGITTPIFGSFRFINDTARAELQVPLGSDRRVFVAVFDSANVMVASGEATVEIGSGVAVSVPVAIAPTSGSQPIIVRVGNTIVSVTPGSLTLELGDSTALAVSVTDQDGVPITGAVPSFASSNPAIASVSPTGVVTGRLQGVTAVTVTALGVAARIPVGVVVPSLRSP
jgi:hypothetical protein